MRRPARCSCGTQLPHLTWGAQPLCELARGRHARVAHPRAWAAFGGIAQLGCLWRHYALFNGSLLDSPICSPAPGAANTAGAADSRAAKCQLETNQRRLTPARTRRHAGSRAPRSPQGLPPRLFTHLRLALWREPKPATLPPDKEDVGVATAPPPRRMPPRGLIPSALPPRAAPPGRDGEAIGPVSRTRRAKAASGGARHRC